MISPFEPQRDSGSKPSNRVASYELPWVGRKSVISDQYSVIRGNLPAWQRCSAFASLTSYWNERKAHETGVVPISSGYTLGFWRGREERGQAQFL